MHLIMICLRRIFQILHSVAVAVMRIENIHHFSFKCPFYNIVRNDILHEVSTLHEVSLKLLLYGNPNLSNDLNTRIFESVHRYILKTKRFSSN